MEELELQTNNEIQKQTAVSGDIAVSSTNNYSKAELFLTGMKRGAASTFDFTAIGLLALAPWLLKQVQHLSIIAAPEALISDESLLISGMFLAMTPIPLIYLRIVFHKLMRSPTPGEFFGWDSNNYKRGLARI